MLRMVCRLTACLNGLCTNLRYKFIINISHPPTLSLICMTVFYYDIFVNRPANSKLFGQLVSGLDFLTVRLSYESIYRTVVERADSWKKKRLVSTCVHFKTRLYSIKNRLWLYIRVRADEIRSYKLRVRNFWQNLNFRSVFNGV